LISTNETNKRIATTTSSNSNSNSNSNNNDNDDSNNDNNDDNNMYILTIKEIVNSDYIIVTNIDATYHGGLARFVNHR